MLLLLLLLLLRVVLCFRTWVPHGWVVGFRVVLVAFPLPRIPCDPLRSTGLSVWLRVSWREPGGREAARRRAYRSETVFGQGPGWRVTALRRENLAGTVFGQESG